MSYEIKTTCNNIGPNSYYSITGRRAKPTSADDGDDDDDDQGNSSKVFCTSDVVSICISQQQQPVRLTATYNVLLIRSAPSTTLGQRIPHIILRAIRSSSTSLYRQLPLSPHPAPTVCAAHIQRLVVRLLTASRRVDSASASLAHQPEPLK